MRGLGELWVAAGARARVRRRKPVGRALPSAAGTGSTPRAGKRVPRGSGKGRCAPVVGLPGGVENGPGYRRVDSLRRAGRSRRPRLRSPRGHRVRNRGRDRKTSATGATRTRRRGELLAGGRHAGGAFGPRCRPPFAGNRADGSVGRGSPKDRGLGDHAGRSAQADRDLEASGGFSRRRTRRRRHGRGEPQPAARDTGVYARRSWRTLPWTSVRRKFRPPER
jgi:hypothetical protein